MRNTTYRNYFRKLKPKNREVVDDRAYYDHITTVWTSMFTYGISDTKYEELTKEFKQLIFDVNYSLEYFLRRYGLVGFWKDKTGIHFGKAQWAGQPTQAGYFTEVTIVCENGMSYQGKVGEDVAIIMNNKNASPDFCINQMVEYLTEIDKSQWDLLINSRMHPIIIAPDEETKNVIQNALENSKLGYNATIANSGAIGQELLTGKDAIKVLTLTDPNTATLFQYYEHHHKDILDRFYGKYGVSTCNTNKMAQTNDLEVSGTISTSLIVPLQNYECRVDGLRMVEDVTGVKFNIAWGDVWQTQLQLFENLDATKNVTDGNTATPPADGDGETTGKIDPNSDEK